MRYLINTFVVTLGLLSVASGATTTQPARRADIALSTTTEDGKKLLVATVTVDGKPQQDVRVAFFVKRTFGDMSVGEETTLDDGTAAVPFPEGLPAGPTGELQVIARLKDPAKTGPAEVSTTMSGGVVVPRQAEPFPRAIWAPRAPIPLLLVFAVLLGGVWFTYAYVFIQLRKIRRTGASV